ncbi:MAG TPA: DUF1080 domain-containing protein [Candidatus Polarisedimenticolia bacterium]|nr:DUF1080 domain-containing protein [Candidatus Polarisedimenticolia bacterium]
MKTLRSLPAAIALACSIFTTSVFAQDAAKTITPSHHIELFNGKDLKGWIFVTRSNAEPAATWSVTNGVIHCTGKPPGYARTDKSYRNYKLTVEWRFVTIAPKADNSGIFLHINPPDKVWPTCIEVQGQHGRQGDLRMNGSATARGHETAATKNADAKASSNERPVGEWNLFEVECSGDVIKLWTNGKLMNEIAGCSVSSGAIGIQSEGGEIEVRKIFIEPLKP